MTQQPQNGTQVTNMTTFTWNITQLLTVPEPTPDYVFIANYVVNGVENNGIDELGNLIIYKTSVENTAKFTINPEQKNYTPYNQLTESQILGWIKETPNLVFDMESCVQANIDAQKNPTVSPEITPLPWSVEPVVEPVVDPVIDPITFGIIT